MSQRDAAQRGAAQPGADTADRGPVTGGEPVRLRPRRIRVVCWVSAVVVVVLFAVIATTLTGPTGNGYGTFQRGDQFAMIGLGVLFALGALLFTRPRVEADARGVRVRNIIGSYELPWEVVRGIRFDRGAPWAALELYDDDLLPVVALQAADKQHAVDGVRALRRLHQAHLAALAERTPGP
ncbi:PH domain-containing protein [Micromonospora gifhornensis]|uniref:PH domain-containing protein n=1 Tax=Verrucosispora sp. FIM060022 TaxID=1479020 RepID=UPI0009DA0CE3|nr:MULTISPECIES: PH domain-containing protein [Micromonospora]RUL91200.1 PH domain-containing protein [Verrucosispora sp. FIM060022]